MGAACVGEHEKDEEKISSQIYADNLRKMKAYRHSKENSARCKRELRSVDRHKKLKEKISGYAERKNQGHTRNLSERTFLDILEEAPPHGVSPTDGNGNFVYGHETYTEGQDQRYREFKRRITKEPEPKKKDEEEEEEPSPKKNKRRSGNAKKGKRAKKSKSEDRDTKSKKKKKREPEEPSQTPEKRYEAEDADPEKREPSQNRSSAERKEKKKKKKKKKDRKD